MSKGRVVLLGLVISLLVPIIHLITLEVSTSYKNSTQSDRSNISIMKQPIQEGVAVVVEDAARYSQGHLHIFYWYSYTAIDFLRDFIVSMLVYWLIVVVLRVLRLKTLKHRKIS